MWTWYTLITPNNLKYTLTPCQGKWVQWLYNRIGQSYFSIENTLCNATKIQCHRHWTLGHSWNLKRVQRYAVGAKDQGLNWPLKSYPRCPRPHLRQSILVEVTPRGIWPRNNPHQGHPQYHGWCYFAPRLQPCPQSAGHLDDFHTVLVLLCIPHHITPASNTPRLHELSVC